MNTVPRGNYKMNNMQITRRRFIHTTGAALAGMSIPLMAGVSGRTSSRQKHEICLFSKHLQYLDFREMSDILARIGFDGIDLTVRPGGHIEPENVERDLPLAVRAAESAGLKIPMMTTGITDPDDRVSLRVLQVAAEHGVRYYRMGSMGYDPDTSTEDNLNRFREVFGKFEAINRRYGIHGDYQNHWGRNFGAPVWDLYYVLNGLDAQWIGCQYDIRHAVVEGGGSWLLGFNAIAPYISSIVMKDFVWAENNGEWAPRSVPLGTGMVDFERYLGEFKRLENTGPVSLHYEYGIGNSRNREDLSDDRIIEFYKSDLETLLTKMNEAGLREA